MIAIVIRLYVPNGETGTIPPFWQRAERENGNGRAIPGINYETTIEFGFSQKYGENDGGWIA